MTASADNARWERTRRVGERGLTLIELLVATAIFVMLGLGVVTMVAGALKVWRSFEYRRNAYEAAQWVFGLQARDLAAAYTREPMGVDLIKARFLVDRQGPGGTPRLMFVRTIESGPERAVTYFSGGGGLRVS